MPNKNVPKPVGFYYNDRHMIWLRKGFVHLLSVVMLVSLVGMAIAIGFTHAFSHPAKLESWLADSKLYDHLIAAALDQSQKSGNDNGSSGTVSLSDPAVKQAAEKAFSPQLLQNSVGTLLDSNYAWLSGKTAKPGFSIDLSKAKLGFAQSVGQASATYLAGLPVCSPTQLAQIPIPLDPLTASCRPAALDPKVEGASVTQEINNSGDFLSDPVITASTLNQNQKSNQSQPYYQKLSYAPRAYKLGLKLPWILGALALLSILGIVFIAPQRRRGLRRVAIVLLEASLILLLVKFVADTLVNRSEDKIIRGNTLAGQLKQPISYLLHKLESQLVQPDLWFGIAFLLIALLIFIALFRTRKSTGQPKPPRVSPVTMAAAPEPPHAQDANNLRLKPRQRPAGGDTATGLNPATSRPGSTNLPPVGKNPPRPKRPRLIQ